mgnify:CR=1 FL=1
MSQAIPLSIQRSVFERWLKGDVSARRLAKETGLARNTVTRIIRFGGILPRDRRLLDEDEIRLSVGVPNAEERAAEQRIAYARAVKADSERPRSYEDVSYNPPLTVSLTGDDLERYLALRKSKFEDEPRSRNVA